MEITDQILDQSGKQIGKKTLHLNSRRISSLMGNRFNIKPILVIVVSEKETDKQKSIQ